MNGKLGKMDDICFRMSCAVGLIEAVHECIEHGYNESESYSDALYGASDYLSGLVDEMRGVVNSAISETRNGETA